MKFSRKTLTLNIKIFQNFDSKKILNENADSEMFSNFSVKPLTSKEKFSEILDYENKNH